MWLKSKVMNRQQYREEKEVGLKSICVGFRGLQYEYGKNRGSWAAFIDLYCIWKILVIILHFIMGAPAKPKDKKIIKASHWTEEWRLENALLSGATNLALVVPFLVLRYYRVMFMTVNSILHANLQNSFVLS